MLFEASRANAIDRSPDHHDSFSTVHTSRVSAVPTGPHNSRFELSPPPRKNTCAAAGA